MIIKYLPPGGKGFNFFGCPLVEGDGFAAAASPSYGALVGTVLINGSSI